MAEIEKKPVKIVETILRDAHQSLIATRMTTEQMMPIVEKMDKVGYHAVECWGGATFDASLRFLKEDPWERLRKFRDGFKNTKNTAADKIKEISETSRSERQRDFATAYTGVKLSSPDNWVDELRTHYYGATNKQGDAGKIDMKFGEGCFTVERIKQMLINNDGLKDLLEGYNKLLEDVNKNLDAVESAKKTIGDEDTDKNANMSAYCQAYLDLYTDAQNACSSVHAIIKQYYDSQWTQATQMLMTIVGTKKKEEEKPEEKKEEGKPAPTKEEKKEEK